MGKGLLIAAIVFGCIAILSGIAALATANWIKACVPFDDILNGVEGLSAGQPNAQLDQLDQYRSLLSGKSLCYNTGLFGMSVEFMSFHMGLALSHSVPAIKIASGLVIGGLILVGVAVMVLIGSACSRTMSAHKQVQVKAYCRIAVAIMACGTLLYGAGMLTYTVEQSTSVIHNSTGYLVQMGSALQNSFQGVMGNEGMGGSSSNMMTGFPNFNGGAGKRKRQVLPDQEQQIPMKSEHHVDSELTADEIQKKARAMFANMDPVFGYSYYVAWLGFVFSFLSIAFAIVSVMQKRLYGDDVDPLPVF